MILWIITALIFAGADQYIKYLVIENIALTDTITILHGIVNFVYVKNTGAAFSIFTGKTYILGIISLVVCVGILLYFIIKKPENKLLNASLAMILGGAAGNLIDRMFRGFVVDYIELCFVKFPVFNLADIAITLGAVLLMVYVIFFDSKKG